MSKQQTTQEQISEAMDLLLTRVPCRKHEWTETTPDDPIRMCKRCGWFALAADLEENPSLLQ